VPLYIDPKHLALCLNRFYGLLFLTFC
jgi:hypothetical protein